MFASLFVLLYVAHLTADYALQTDHQVTHKAGAGRRAWLALGAHAGTHVLVTAAALAGGALVLDEVQLSPLPTLLALAWIGLTHAGIDRRWPITWWMTHTGSEDWISRDGAAHVDQTAHTLALCLAALGLTATA
ncbi:DUF3307 domain-containing protein [Streptomyces sp. NPDC051662]|uniref:DUF3307 domain-containing protein n=1 Tax=Streptomyces sp. NPDC051662 TaxID=3154750 RepID=UPI003414B40D